MKYCLSLLLCLVCSLLLVGCSGGGGGGGGEQTTSITGSIFAVAGSEVDSDVNDPESPFVSANDSFVSAQLIANFATLGGHLNQPGEGQDGRTFLAGDVDDYYEIDLQAGQSVALLMEASPVDSDIDLALFDSNQMMVDQSISNGPEECVENLAAGKHFIRADILRGASNYIFSVTSFSCSETVASSGSLRLAVDLMPDEMVVKFRDSEAMSAMHSDMSAMGMSMEMTSHQRYARVYIKDMAMALNSMAAAAIDEGHMPESMQAKARTLAAIKAMQRNSNFEMAEPNYIHRTSATPNDPFFQRQWHYPLISLPDAWDQAVGGSGATVAVLDTGVLTEHPDLQSNLIAGYDFISDLDSAIDGNGIDNDPGDPGIGLTPGSSAFHGSHVTGTVVAVSNNSAGISGAAFYSNIKVMPLRVVGAGGGTSTDICEALRYAARLSNVSNTLPTSAADVVNMSFGSMAFSQFFQDCINDANAEGLILVASAGNFASTALVYPAAYNGVIAVSAVDLSENLASYSSFGVSIDVAAPGGEFGDDNGDGVIDGVFSTVGDDSSGTIINTYGYLVGTSMAAPHVSAVAALMKSVTPALTPSLFEAYLTAGELSDDLGSVGRDDSFGHGLINANKAVLRAQGMDVNLSTPVLSAAPSGINFGFNESVAPLSVRNVGGGSLNVNIPTENSGGWLSITAPVGNDEGEYTITANRNHPSLANPGSYSAILSFTSNGGAINLPVSLQVLQTGQSDSANAGHQFILLFDEDSGELVTGVDVDVQGGRYDFRFDNIAPGTYLLFTGTDNNNDFFICDAGESCGAFGTVDAPISIVVDASGIVDVGSFFTRFNFAPSASPTSAAASVISAKGIARR